MGVSGLRIIKSLFLYFVLICCIFSIPRNARSDDFQIWTEVKFSKKFKPSKFTLLWAMENRVKNDATQYFLFNTTIGFSYAFFKWFQIAPQYRFEKKVGSDGENRPLLDIVFQTPWQPIQVKNRQRFEFRIFPDMERFRYRNRTTLFHKFKDEKVTYSPYIQDEFFLETNNGGFNENRLDVGNTFGFFKDRIKFALYYRWQRKLSSGVWANNYILGTILGFHY